MKFGEKFSITIFPNDPHGSSLLYAGSVASPSSDRTFRCVLAVDFSLKMPFLTILALHGVDEYREAFYMALESCFEAFDADEVTRRSHRHRIPS